MLYVYIGCFTFGLVYSILSAVLGTHGGVDHGHGGGNDAGIPSAFNPLVIASAIATFGAVGIIGKFGFKMGGLTSAVFALTLAGIVGTAVFFGVVKLMYGSQSNSTFSRNDLISTEAEVITPLSKNGMGEVVYVINGVRCSLPAKSANNEEIAKGETVIIRDIVSSIALVSQKMTIDEYNLPDSDETQFGKNE